jgi:hypothetical protein
LTGQATGCLIPGMAPVKPPSDALVVDEPVAETTSFSLEQFREWGRRGGEIGGRAGTKAQTEQRRQAALKARERKQLYRRQPGLRPKP